MNKNLLGILAIFVVGCSQDLQSTSMYAIIANPQKYEGEKVRISGYYVHEFENRAIYITPYANENYVAVDGFWVEFSPEFKSQLYTSNGVDHPKELEKYSHRHVLLEGEFTASKNGHMGAYTGTIVNATRIMARDRN